MNATTAAKLAFVSVEEGCGPHSDDKCAVCLGEYVAGQRLCFLPCSHKYHAQVSQLSVGIVARDVHRLALAVCECNAAVCDTLVAEEGGVPTV